MVEEQQLNLFSKIPTSTDKQQQLVMDANTLEQWKSQIFDYQQQTRSLNPHQQTTLFDLTPSHCDPDKIDPFNLKVRSLAFWRMPADSHGDSCLYFVIDNQVPLLLYVGETCRSNKRWKGIHDCKDYIASYLDLHYKYKLQTAVNIAFWWDAPTDRRSRQQLELKLILKWRSPFNKENWEKWGQPFK